MHQSRQQRDKQKRQKSSQGVCLTLKKAGQWKERWAVKVVTYIKRKEDDKHNDNERNKSNKNQ